MNDSGGPSQDQDLKGMYALDRWMEEITDRQILELGLKDQSGSWFDSLPTSSRLTRLTDRAAGRA